MEIVMIMKKYFILFLLILINSCSDNIDVADDNEGIVSRVPATGFEDIEEAIVVDGEVKEIEVIAKKWDFEPSTIEVAEGERVKLRIKSVDVEHGFSIPQFNVNEFLRPGEITVVEFRADKKGEYTYFCSVYCGEGHKDMKGKLIVN